MTKLKITAAQIIALRSATMRDNGSYELTTAKGQTVNALTRVGILVSGTRFLTVQGVSVMHSVSDVSVIASKGHTTYVSNSPESLEMFTLPERESVQSTECTCAPNGDNSWCAAHYPAPVIADGMDTRFPMVEIQGEEPNTWAPDFDAVGARECYFGCGSSPVVVFVTHVGVTEGLCERHSDRVEGPTYELPTVTTEERQTNAESVTDEFVPMDRTGDGITSVMTVAVIQNTPGMSGVTHYHTPGCRDIQREMRKYGQSARDAFENGFDSVAEILEFEFGDIASDNAESNTPEWWAEIFYNATGDEFGGVKIMPCLSIPNGVTSDGSPVVTQGNFFRAGFKAPSQESVNEARAMIDAHNFNTCDERECVTCMVKLTEECQEAHTIDKACAACSAVVITYDESARKFPCMSIGGVILHKGECAQAHGVNGPVCSLENEDAGFVETDSVEDYAIVSRLTTGAGFHTVPDAPQGTGTTHHSMDAHGGQWERFDHVLSVGDVVKSVEGLGLFTVHALIPGLPVVYVDPCDGRAPFPVGATKLYAL